MELSNLSFAQLKDLQQRIPAELKRREEAEKQAFLNEMRVLAESRGLSLDDLMGKPKKAARAGGTVKVKYRHPNNSALEWTGRGRKPLWVVEWLNQGNAIEGLLV
jgi:DNA-binding protein H-NS